MQMQVQLKYKPEQIVYRYCSQHILSLIFSSTHAPWRVLYMLPIHILHPAIKFEFVFLFCLGKGLKK